MGDLVNFPTWIFEKEKALNDLEFDLNMRSQWLDMENEKVKNFHRTKRMFLFSAFAVGFCCGLGLTFLLFLMQS